ncbi:hypothetical protein BDR26DRAFT_651861 [Obelidium mucronatum]|nr:hypothetical protein BDR26DRAFT_651861 [Obelidium mucronatum]
MLRTLSQHRRHALNLISRVSVGGSLAGRRIPCPSASPSKTTFRFTSSVSNPSGGSSSQSKLLNQINQKNSMDRLYQTFDSVMKEPNTKPSLISNAALLSLASTTLLNASPFASPNLAVSLVSPHPGAVAILDEAVVWTANEINADVVTLDYLEILSLIEEEKRMDQVANLTHSPTIQLPIQPSSITLSSSFRPELYSPAADVGQKTINLDDDIDDEDEFDDDEDAGPPGINARAIFGGMMRGSSSPAVHHHHHQTFPRHHQGNCGWERS